ncbi:MAG: DUF1294 domain-containing protein [Schwartzia sp.]|nr:DUF1294 domain-containing protein [Schwartzia sp. (in: firmicutes)]
MNDIHRISAIYLLILNLAAIAVYGWDKLCARQGWRRIPEKVLLLLAVLGGSIGAVIAMALFRHKTRHLKFRYGLPLLIILQAVLLLWLHWGGKTAAV